MIIDDLRKNACPQKAKILQKFFKTGPGEYGEGDIFWGITVPLIRKVACDYKYLDGASLEKMLDDNVHEVRLCALLIMVLQTKINPDAIYKMYTKKIDRVNNWDLVDLSAPTVVGNFLIDKDSSIFYRLAKSDNFWHRRIAIVSTYAFIKQGSYEETLNISEKLLHDKHDLIQKAVGWMLREVGKRCSMDILEEFLEKYCTIMPRTMLRYSIEHMSDQKRKIYMNAKRLHKSLH